MPTLKELQDSLQFILAIGGLIGLCVFLYEYLTDDKQKRSHRQLIDNWLKNIKQLRSLELAKRDAHRLLRIINMIYGPKGEELKNCDLLSSKNLWLWRPLIISIGLASLYVIPSTLMVMNNALNFKSLICRTQYDFLDVVNSSVRYIIIFLPINALLDLLSVNISRKLLFFMSKSTNPSKLVSWALIDLVVGFFLYMIGPLWMSVEYILGPDFWKMLEIRLEKAPEIFLTQSSLLLNPYAWRNANAFLIMYVTTLLPTAMHLIITIVFFGSKFFAEPLRAITQDIITYMIKIPKGITALFAFLGTILIIVLVWAIIFIF